MHPLPSAEPKCPCRPSMSCGSLLGFSRHLLAENKPQFTPARVMTLEASLLAHRKPEGEPGQASPALPVCPFLGGQGHHVATGVQKPRADDALPSPGPTLHTESGRHLGQRQALPRWALTGRATWPYLKPLHYSKTIIRPAMLRGQRAPTAGRHLPFPGRLHRPGQALNDSDASVIFIKACSW